jgi:hypothetical protein
MAAEMDNEGLVPLTPQELGAVSLAAENVVRQTNLDKAYAALEESCSTYYTQVWEKAFNADMGEDIQGTSLAANKEKKFKEKVEKKAARYQKFFNKMGDETEQQFGERCREFAAGEIRELYEATGRTRIIEPKFYDKAIDAVTKKIAQGFTKVRNFFRKAKIVLKETFTRENRGEVIKNLLKTGWQAMKTAFQTVRTAVGVEVDRLVEKAKFSHIATDVLRGLGDKLGVVGVTGEDRVAKESAQRASEAKLMDDRATDKTAHRDKRTAAEEALREKRGIRSREQAGKSKGGGGRVA